MTKDEFITKRTRIISEMIDNHDKYGIYPTTICFEALNKLFDELIKQPEIDTNTPFFGNSGAKVPIEQPEPVPVSAEEILGLLNKYTTTDIEWIAQAHGTGTKVIDPMDYHKIASQLRNQPVQEQSKVTDEPFDAVSFVESCGDLAIYIKGKHFAYKFRKLTIPVIEFNELRERAKEHRYGKIKRVGD